MNMTIIEARKILGKEADKMSDDEIEHLIVSLECIASATIKSIREGKIELSAIERNGK